MNCGTDCSAGRGNLSQHPRNDRRTPGVQPTSWLQNDQIKVVSDQPAGPPDIHGSIKNVPHRETEVMVMQLARPRSTVSFSVQS